MREEVVCEHKRDECQISCVDGASGRAKVGSCTHMKLQAKCASRAACLRRHAQCNVSRDVMQRKASKCARMATLTVNLVLDGSFALLKGGANLAGLRIVGGTGHLGLELGLQRPAKTQRQCQKSISKCGRGMCS